MATGTRFKNIITLLASTDTYTMVSQAMLKAVRVRRPENGKYYTLKIGTAVIFDTKPAAAPSCAEIHALDIMLQPGEVITLTSDQAANSGVDLVLAP